MGGSIPCIQSLTEPLKSDYGNRFLYCLAPTVLTSTTFDIGDNRTCMMPDIFTSGNKSVVRLELSQTSNCKPIFKIISGTVLPKPPLFSSTTECFIGDVLCTLYGFANFNGANTLKIRLDEFFIKTKGQILSLPPSFKTKTLSTSSTMSPEDTELAAFLLDDQSIITQSKNMKMYYS